MQIVTRQYKTYTFEELSKEIQSKVLDDNRDWNVNSWNENGWAEFVLEEKTEMLKNLGFEDIKIMFSGFWSQGDGACFEARLNIAQYIKSHKLGNKLKALLNAEDCFTYNISQSGHYYHERSMIVEQGFWGEPSTKAQDQAENLLKLLEAEIINLAHGIYKDLEKEYEYLTSDEAVKESLITNDYQFTEDGKIFN